MSNNVVRALAICLAIIGSVRYSFAIEAKKSFSPDRNNWVSLTYDKHRISAKFGNRATAASVFSDMPFSGAVGVTWLDNSFAQLSASCGTGCSATYFASVKGASGPFPLVLSADAQSRTFAYVRDSVITLSTIEPPVRTLGTLAVPNWCAALACDFHESYVAGRYTFKADEHEIWLPLPKAD